MLLGGNLVMGIALLVLAVTVELPVQVAVAFVAGIVQSMVLVTYLTLRTAHSPDELLGRIGSTARTISLGLQPVGLLIGGALIDLTSGSTTMALMGIAVAAVSAASSRRSRRSARASLAPALRRPQAARASGSLTGAADDLDPDGAACALELVALGDLDGRRTGAPWAFDVEHHCDLSISAVSGIDAPNHDGHL